MAIKSIFLFVVALLFFNKLPDTLCSDFETLSYSRDILYGNIVLTSEQPEIATKTSGFFGSLTKYFRAPSTTESNYFLHTQPTPTSNIVIQPPLLPKNQQAVYANNAISSTTAGKSNIKNLNKIISNPPLSAISFTSNSEKIAQDHFGVKQTLEISTTPFADLKSTIEPAIGDVKPNSDLTGKSLSVPPTNNYDISTLQLKSMPVRPHLLFGSENKQVWTSSRFNNNSEKYIDQTKNLSPQYFGSSNVRSEFDSTAKNLVNPDIVSDSPTIRFWKREYGNQNDPITTNVNQNIGSGTATFSTLEFNNENFPRLPSPQNSNQRTIENYSQYSSPKSTQTHSISTRVGQYPVSSISNSYSEPLPTLNNRDGGIASDAEILQLSENLFNKDTNNQNRFITLNLQGKTRSSERTDKAQNKLMEINEQAFRSNSIMKLIDLFDNYELDTMVNENVAPIERKEESEFLDSIMSTSVMTQAMLFLQQKGLVTSDPEKHRDLIRTIWFTLYSRGRGRLGSSAFEHVFLSETKNGSVIGLHNWIYFYEQEKNGNIDYKGYIKKIDLGTKGFILKIRFSHNGVEKPVNSLFVGTSPELELALYTICFQVRPDSDCPVALAGKLFNIVTHTFRYRGKKLIGSAYPEI